MPLLVHPAGERRPYLRQAADLVSALLILLFSAVAFVPLMPLMPHAGLDSAWAFGVNTAVEQGLVFGRDLVFTFGPYASLYTLQYHPSTDAMTLWGSLLVALAVGAGLCVLSARRGRVAALVLTVFMASPWLRDPVYFVPPAVFLAVACRVLLRPGAASPLPTASSRLVLPILVLLTLALAILPLVKGTFAAASGAILGLVVLLLLARRRWRLAVGLPLVFLAAMLLFWVLSGQPPTALPGFFLAQAPIIGGYTDAMSIEGPFWQVVLAATASLAVLLCNLRRRLSLEEAALVLGLALLLFLAFKAGLVRHDGHVIITGFALAFLAWLPVLGYPEADPAGGQGGWRRPALGLAIALVACAGLVLPEGNPTPLGNLVQSYREAVRGAVLRLTQADPFGSAFAGTMAGVRREHPLPAITGSIDSYSYGQSILLAHGLHWSPRPILQSYSAYLPVLAESNRRHLEGPRAPDNLLFAVEPIDGRLPSLEDGASWPDILARYEAVTITGGRALLRRLPEARWAPPMLGETLGQGRYALGQPVALPPNQTAVWATVSVKPTLLGRIVALLYKPPVMAIRLALTGGKQEEYRFVSGMGEAGFLLSPVVGDTAQFLSLTLPGAGLYEERVPVSFSIQGQQGSRWLWQNAVDVQFRAVRLPQSSTVRTVLFPPAVREEPAQRPLLTGQGKCFLDTLDGHDFPRVGPMRLDGRRRLTGWGFLQLPEATNPEAMRLVLTSADGVAHAFPVRMLPRPDVGVYFGQPQLNGIGFEAQVDVAEMPGRYGVELELHGGGRVQSCTLYPTAEVSP